MQYRLWSFKLGDRKFDKLCAYDAAVRPKVYECAEVHCASSLRLNPFATYVKDILSTEHKKYSSRGIEFVS